MRNIILSVFTLVLLLSGCATPHSESPLATNFETSEQKKLQAASHWESVVNHLATSIVEQIGTKNTVYISEPKDKTKFNVAFHSLLLSAFIKHQIIVSKLPQTADINIDLTVDLIKFTKDRAANRNSFGTPTLLTAGAWTIAGIGAANGSVAAAGALTGAGAVGYDVYNWFGSKYAAGQIPQNEIIVSVQASTKTQYLASITNIYYVADTDTSLYKTAKVFKVTGEQE